MMQASERIWRAHGGLACAGMAALLLVAASSYALANERPNDPFAGPKSLWQALTAPFVTQRPASPPAPVAAAPALPRTAPAERRPSPPIVRRPESQRPEPRRAEPVRSEPVRGEPVRSEPVRGEPRRAERPVPPAPIRARSEELMASSATAYAAEPRASAPSDPVASMFGFWLSRHQAAPQRGPAPPVATLASTMPEPPAPRRDLGHAAVFEPARREPARRGIAAPRNLPAMIDAAARRHGVPPALAHAVVTVESNYNPGAVGGRAIGLMQIKHATAQGMGFAGSREELFDPATNLEWGMRYLAGARRLARGDICGTVMRYQSGHRAERMNEANRAYCARVREIMADRGAVVADSRGLR